VAIKFEAPVFSVARQHHGSAARAGRGDLQQYHAGGSASAQDYLLFQDYIFRYLITQAGALRLQVHIHSAVGAATITAFRRQRHDLENILRDPRYKDTTFVLIHGGILMTSNRSGRRAAERYLDPSEFILLVFPTEYSTSETLAGSLPRKLCLARRLPYSREVNVPATYWLGVRPRGQR